MTLHQCDGGARVTTDFCELLEMPSKPPSSLPSLTLRMALLAAAVLYLLISFPTP